MTDRDVTILMLALVVSMVVGVADFIIEINPAAQDSILNVGLVFGVAWGFYRLRG